MNKVKISSIIFFLFSTAWIFFIISNSLKTGVSSSAQSGEISSFIAKVCSFFSNHTIWSFDEIEHLVRKSAHFIEFFILGLFSSICLCNTVTFKRKFYIYSLFIGLFVAVCDEFVQGFIPARSSEVRDIVLDFTGVFCGATVVFLLWRFVFKKKRKHYSQKRT